MTIIEYLRQINAQTLEKGIEIVQDDPMAAMMVDKNRSAYEYQVESQSDPEAFYLVSLDLKKRGPQCTCDCPAFESYGKCKHIVAALLDLLLLEYDSSPFEEIEEVLDAIQEINVETAQAKRETSKTKLLKEPEWKKFTSNSKSVWQTLSWNIRQEKTSRLDVGRTQLVRQEEQDPAWYFEYRGPLQNIHHPIITYDGFQTFSYRCSCDSKAQMCIHVSAAFQFLEMVDHQIFTAYRNYDPEKSKILAEYGLTLNDPEAVHFNFSVDHWDNLVYQPPTWILKTNDKNALQRYKTLLAPIKDGVKAVSKPMLAYGQIMDFRLGFLLNFNSQKFGLGFEFEPFKIYSAPGAAKNNFKKLNFHLPENLAFLSSLPDEVYAIIESLTEKKLKEFLQNHGMGHVVNYSSPFNHLTDGAYLALRKHYIRQLQQLWPWLSQQPEVFVLTEGKFSSQSLQPISVQMPLVKLKAELAEDDRFLTVKIKPQSNGLPLQATLLKLMANAIFWGNGRAWMIEDLHDSETLSVFPKGLLILPKSEKASFIKTLLPGLQQRYQLQMPASFNIEQIDATPGPQVLVKEYQNQYLMLQPQFVYNNETVDYEPNPEDILLTADDGGMQIIPRNSQVEHDFFNSLKLLHPAFKTQKQPSFYFLPFADVMKNNWFLETVRRLQENNVPVLGIQELKKFKYNSSKPKWEMKAGSGIDWFELEIQVSFGEELVPLKDIRKALLNRQNTVLLGDGSFGLLPEEWLKQYGLLLKMGEEQKNNTLRLNKLHFTLIDELHQQLNDEEITAELEAKKQKLSGIHHIETVKPSEAISASLRPYQLSGFNWLQTLDELGWGACLADDMGLGKTLQTITFLQYIKEKHTGSTHLIICPTSLIYNWENELKKFAPQLRYHVYYGKDREFSNEHFEDYDLVITSYGLVRNDLSDLLQFEWHYVILDESQAIKNPDAQTTRAVQLLKSKNRIILSGTPVQNNTYDLYAQFQFINPGLLGNKEFFRTEFANPIDKNNDPEKSAALRKLVYPFLMRRTKEQVATDLPDKTEITLWCEMGNAQRTVYNDYKNYYRAALLKKIEEVGMANAAIYVLEGLLRLRQICDSPRLLKSDEIKTQDSIKIEELKREITENTGNHKLLVFSQFTEMLALLEATLQQENIPYSYLDGSTPAAKRQQAVDEFQNNPKVKVFLISLKAGAVGLNLTAADYVYIVDPWWNPAVEQQAIDRTHRIGQTRKIFAYRMICKDSVEEKIMELQQRKKQLANELVTEDAGFIKKLTKEDITFLFS